MRFLEALLIFFAVIFVAQLLISILILAALMLFLWCLYKRPREALVLGLAVLAVAFISTPIGLALVAMIGLGLGLRFLVGWMRGRRRASCRPIPLLEKPRGDSG